MHRTQTAVDKGSSGKCARDCHFFARLQIHRIVYCRANIFPDQADRHFAVRIAKRIRIERNIGLNGMRQCVHSRRCRDKRRHMYLLQRINDGKFGH